MADNQSMLSSIYWDTTSITSGATIDCFQTPTGSFFDLSNEAISNDDCVTNSGSVTPTICDTVIVQEMQSMKLKDKSDTAEEYAVGENNNVISTSLERPTRPPPIKLKKSVSIQIESQPDSTRRCNSEAIFTKHQIRQSMSEDGRKARGVRDVLRRMRNSIKRFTPFDRYKSKRNKIQSTIDDSMETDFLKCSTLNSYQNSQAEELKSIFDLCSTIDLLANVYLSTQGIKMKIPSLLKECASAFLDMGQRQIEDSVRDVNQYLGRYFNLASEGLEIIDRNKKYKVKQYMESTDVCIIVDTQSKHRFVALKLTPQRSWISFTGFLQHMERETDIVLNQRWVCYEVNSITNMQMEMGRCKQNLGKLTKVLDCLLRLLTILHSQCRQDGTAEIHPGNITLISSNHSVICVITEPGASSENSYSTDNTIADQDMTIEYRKSLQDLEIITGSFLSDISNSCHLISASYPLDYLFFVLIKLYRDLDESPYI